MIVMKGKRRKRDIRRLLRSARNRNQVGDLRNATRD